jgi:hypothetical protein
MRSDRGTLVPAHGAPEFVGSVDDGGGIRGVAFAIGLPRLVVAHLVDPVAAARSRRTTTTAVAR